MDEPAPASPAVEPITPAQPAAEDSSPQPTPVAEPTTSAPQEPTGQAEQAPIDEPAPEAPQSETEHPSRLDRRIDQLENKSAGINDLLGNLKQFRDQASSPVPEMPQPRLSELLQGRESLDPAELDQLGQQVAQASTVNADLKYAQLATRVAINEAITEAERDAAVVTNTYDELKKDTPTYSEKLEQKIEARFKREAFIPNPLNPKQMLLNPRAKLADIAKEEVEAWRQAVESGKAQTNATLATQSDNSAVTPTTDSPVEKSFDDMSLEEQENYLRAKGHQI